MGKKRHETSTQKLLRAVEECDSCLCKNFPPEFLIGLRGVIDAGISCEQITAFLVLASGWYKTCDRMGGPELVERARMLSDVMSGDVDEEIVIRKRIEAGKQRRAEKERMKKRKQREEGK